MRWKGLVLLFIRFQGYSVPGTLVYSTHNVSKRSLSNLGPDLKILRNGKNRIKSIGLTFFYQGQKVFQQFRLWFTREWINFFLYGLYTEFDALFANWAERRLCCKISVLFIKHLYSGKALMCLAFAALEIFYHVCIKCGFLIQPSCGFIITPILNLLHLCSFHFRDCIQYFQSISELGTRKQIMGIFTKNLPFFYWVFISSTICWDTTLGSSSHFFPGRYRFILRVDVKYCCLIRSNFHIWIFSKLL